MRTDDLPPKSQDPLNSDVSDRTQSTGGPGGAAAGQIGPYRMLQLIGEGGMGEVWLAEQKTPIHRTVALKLIKAGMDTKTVIARFESERQALALMDHPAIARVFDAGSTPEGRPYFVMEYVPGLPITEYCDKHRLTVKERLELFMQVCEGVQHAHQKAIIHRDLKPSNVLVVEQGGKAVPKIIDFGLAKAMSQRLTDRTLFTELGVMMGTPEYMSPEQADQSEQNIDTRTDVYSLGVILYQLLVGVLPFEAKALRAAGMEAILRVIREQEPPKPSVRIRSMGPASSLSAENRKEDPRTFARHIQGELDWITMKALEKDRTRRYGSPAELSADIKRHLANEPVLAHPPSAGYRAGKYVRRHRLGVAFAATVAVLLVAFAVMMAFQAVRIARERDRAEKNRAEATKQAQLALDTIYGVVTETESQLRALAGTEALRKDLLESAMKNLDGISRTAATSTWADRTTGVALQRMATFYEQMGMTKQQTEALERSLQIFERLMKEDPNQDRTAFDASICYQDLGEIARETEPDPAKIYRYYEQARQLQQKLVETPHQDKPSQPERLRSLAISDAKLSALALEVHDPAKALDYAQRGLTTTAQLGYSPASQSEADELKDIRFSLHRLLGRAQLLMGHEPSARDNYAQCERAQEEWIKAAPLNAHVKQELGRTHLWIGDMELELGNVPASLEQYRKAEEIFTAMIAKDNTNAELKWYLANTHYAIGNALGTSGKQDEAKAYFRRCLPVRRELLDDDAKNIQRRIELMLVNAQLGNTEDALKDAQVVEQYAPRNPGKLFSAACAYAICARSATRGVKREAFIAEAIRLLNMASASGFRDPWSLQHEPELESIRISDSYRQVLNEAH
jgi:serine/threonine protein kinase/tetratricopeptide (TPR) repeat protein